MKLKLFACLVLAGAMVFCGSVYAGPLNQNPFLSVDINGANYGGGQTVGPTAAGFQPFNAFSGFDQLDPAYLANEDWGNNAVAGLTHVYATTQGNVTATMSGVGLNFGARNRGANTGANSALMQDFAFAQRDGAVGFGRNFVRLTLSGLTPNKLYEFTGYAREAAFQAPNLTDPNDPGQSFQAWSDKAKLGGLDGPAAWLDANVSVGASYQPVFDTSTPPVNTGYKNPIPTFVRSQVAGPDSLSQADPYFHSASFATKADGSGVVTVYTWSDPNGFGSTVQGASLLNGFQIVAYTVPEPMSLTIFSLGIVGLMFGRRRSN